MTFTEWIEMQQEAMRDRIAASLSGRNPVDVVIEAEERLIRDTGFNLNHQQVTLNHKEA